MSQWVKFVLKTVTGKEGVAGAAITAGMSLARSILGKRGARANLEFLIGSVLPGKIAPHQLPDEVIRVAEAVAALLKSRGVHPERMASDGVPGSGKSSLAAALAGRLGMEVVCLDHQNLDEPMAFDRASTLYEHYRLLRTQDIESFDVIVYIDEPVELSKAKVLKRKRGAYLVDILDYGRLKRIGQKAFCVPDGQPIAVANSFVKVKIRPEKGFNDLANIGRELSARGLDATGLSKEGALFLCVEGKAASGFRAYLNPHAYDKELLSALTAGLPRLAMPKKRNGKSP